MEHTALGRPLQGGAPGSGAPHSLVFPLITCLSCSEPPEPCRVVIRLLDLPPTWTFSCLSHREQRGGVPACPLYADLHFLLFFKFPSGSLPCHNRNIWIRTPPSPHPTPTHNFPGTSPRLLVTSGLAGADRTHPTHVSCQVPARGREILTQPRQFFSLGSDACSFPGQHQALQLSGYCPRVTKANSYEHRQKEMFWVQVFSPDVNWLLDLGTETMSDLVVEISLSRNQKDGG